MIVVMDVYAIAAMIRTCMFGECSVDVLGGVVESYVSLGASILTSFILMHSRSLAVYYFRFCLSLVRLKLCVDYRNLC